MTLGLGGGGIGGSLHANAKPNALHSFSVEGVRSGWLRVDLTHVLDAAVVPVREQGRGSVRRSKFPEMCECLGEGGVFV